MRFEFHPLQLHLENAPKIGAVPTRPISYTAISCIKQTAQKILADASDLCTTIHGNHTPRAENTMPSHPWYACGFSSLISLTIFYPASPRCLAPGGFPILES